MTAADTNDGAVEPSDIAPGLGDVLPQHRFDEQRLQAHLARHVPATPARFRVRQFQGGHSNPTFLLDAGTWRRVLRKQPPGKLLRGAHQVDREYRVMTALDGSGVPVPRTHLLCTDPDIIGTPFFVMDFVPGLVSAEPHLPDVPMTQRRAVHLAAMTCQATLHSVDWRAVGLADYGRPEQYVARQLKTWSRQFEASRTGDMPAMDNLIRRLGERLPDDVPASIVHGDFRPGNLILDATEPRIGAVLDWELSTLGHPLADLGYYCMPYHLPYGVPGIKGLVGLDLVEAGLPSRDDLLEAYARTGAVPGLASIDYFVAFSLFRLAAILQGVYARALQGNASRADARDVGERAGFLAEHGWAIASRL